MAELLCFHIDDGTPLDRLEDDYVWPMITINSDHVVAFKSNHNSSVGGSIIYTVDGREWLVIQPPDTVEGDLANIKKKTDSYL